MTRKIRIVTEDNSWEAVLNSSSSADTIWEALPLESRVSRWGQEIYFGVPVDVVESDDAREVMETGELAFWPPGSAFCIFFGPTPASTGNEPRAASAVNPLGHVLGALEELDRVAAGSKIRLEKAQEA